MKGINKYKLDCNKVKTVKDVILVLEAMNITVKLRDDNISDAFQVLIDKKMLIKTNEK